jgi:hypothetical protein
MAEDEWMDLHHYFPASKLEDEKEKNDESFESSRKGIKFYFS